MSRLLRAAWEHGAVVGAICAGTIAAARAGLLDGRPHTSNGLDFLKHWVKDYAPRRTTATRLRCATAAW